MNDLISRQAALDAVEKNACNTQRIIEAVNNLPPVQSEPQWISVTERLPDNADHPGAFCPRYQVVTPYGVTEGWYRPHDYEKGGQWFALFWFTSQIYEIRNIDFEKGNVPKVIREAPVMEWRPLPKPYKPNKKQSGKEGA